MEINKQNGAVAFNEDKHVYWNVNDNVRYVSVTTLIERFCQPYDKDFWSAYKALEKLLPKSDWEIEKKSLLKTKKFHPEILTMYGIDENDFNKAQQDILDEWDETNRQSCERGTKIHAELEKSFYKAGKNCNLSKFGIGGKFECRKDYTDLDLPYGVYPEYLIYRDSPDGVLHIAGQIDLIVKNGNEITIIDHKTNKKLDFKSYFDRETKSSIKMKYPLNNLDDCNFNHYQIQLSTYAWMLQKLNPNFVIKRLILNYYDHEGNNTLHECEYLKNDVERMLAFYKKQVILDNKRAMRKPIEY